MDSVKRKNISEAFRASFLVPGAFSKQASYRDYSIRPSAEMDLFSKYAGYMIPKPTQDNVDSYLRDMIYEEINGLGTPSSDITVKFDQIETREDGYITDANGSVMIPVYEKILEIPFIVDNGEILNFDIIKMDNQRVPYSRENLRSVVQGLRRAQEEGTVTDSQTAYKAVAEPNNPSTSPGFLSSTLSVRDSIARNRNTGIFTAAGELDDLLEKVANLKPASDSDFEKLAQICNDKQKDRISAMMDKYADEAEEDQLVSRTEDKLYVAKKSKQYDDAKKLPNFTLIYFYEQCKDSLQKIKGIVLSKFMDVSATPRKNTEKEQKIVLTEDRKVYFLDDMSEFLCEKAPATDNHFAVRSVPVSSLKAGSAFLYLDSKMRETSPIFHFVNRTYFNHSVDMSKDQIGYTDKKTDYAASGGSHTGNPMNTADYDIIMRLNILPNKDTLERAICQSVEQQSSFGVFYPDPIGQINLILKNKEKQGTLKDEPHMFEKKDVSPRERVYITSRDMPVIPIKKAGTCYISPRAEFESPFSEVHAFSEEGGLSKIAASNGFLKLTCKDRNNHIYDLQVRFDDKSKHIFKDSSASYSYIPESKVKSLLRQMNINEMDIRSLILKSRNEPSATYQLKTPISSSDFGKTQGVFTNITKNKVKKTLGKFIDPEKIFNAALFAAMSAGASSIVRNAANKREEKNRLRDEELLGKFASNSEYLSREFEKRAGEEDNSDYLALAKVATICHHFETMCDDLIHGEVYLDGLKAAESMQKSASEFSDFYYGLSDLKNLQHEQKKELISFSKIAAMQEHLFVCSKMAEALLDGSKK